MNIDKFLELIDSYGIWYKKKETEVEMKCPNCEQGSMKDHGHFGILIDNERVVTSHCFKCNFSSMITPNLLKMFGIDEKDIEVLKFDKGNNLTYNRKKIMSEETYVPDLKLENEHLNRSYLDYIANRIEVKLNFATFYEECNIVENPTKFCKDNNLQEQKVWNRVCFLSTSKRYLICRSINQSEPRWLNVSLFPYGQSKTIMSNIYFMPTEIDFSLPVVIYVTEGIIDIISIRYNKILKEDNNILYGASGGVNNYKSVLITLILRGLFGKNVNIVFLIDSDATNIDIYRNQVGELKRFFNSVSIANNLKSKDFGVSKKDIQLSLLRKI